MATTVTTRNRVWAPSIIEKAAPVFWAWVSAR